MRDYLGPRPLLLFAGGFVAGLAAGLWALFSLLLYIILRSRRSALILTVGVLLGWLRGLPSPLPDIQPGESVLRGIVVDEPFRRNGISFTLDLEGDRIRVYRRATSPPALRGDTVEIGGRLAPWRPPTNPGQFDHGERMRRRGIAGTLRSYERHSIEVKPGFHLLRPVDRLRSSLRESLNRRLSENAAGVVAAIVLGYRDGLPRELRNRFQRSGTAHFLAISGLHLGLVFLMILGLASLAGLRGRTRILVVFLFLLAYTLLTGMNTAVLRAFVMISVFLVGRFLRRRRDPVTSLGVAALLITALDPAAVFELSFQLSFIAVLGILWMAPIFHDFLSHPWRINGLIAVSLAAWLSTAPLIQDNFHLVTPLVTVANLIFWPFIALLIAVSLLLLPAPIPPFTWIAEFLVDLLSGLSSAMESLAPVSYFHSPGPAWWLLAVYFLSLVAWATWCRLSPSPRKAVLCSLIAGLLAIPLLSRTREEHPFIAQLDVGRGLCTYVELPDGRNFLFDVGSLDHRDVGETVVAPYLWSRGVRQIDTIFLSHVDADHVNGLESILERFAVRRIVTTPFVDLPWPAERLTVGADPMEVSPGVHVLAPPDWRAYGRPPPSNETSLVVRIGNEILLTGDIMDRAAEWLLQSGHDLRVRVLAAPHHGKWFRLHARFAERTGATILLVSAPGGYHSRKVIDAFPGTVYRTGRDGAIEIRLGPDPEVTIHR